MRFSTWRDELRVEFGFSFLDSTVFRDVDALDLKVYVALCRSVWRSEIKGSLELREVAKKLVIAKIGQETLARRVGVSLATVKRSLERLRESKWVEAIQGHGRELYYSLGTIVDGREDYFLADIVRKVVDVEAAEGLIPAQEPSETAVLEGPTQLTGELPDSSKVSDQVAHGRPTEEVKGEEVKNEQLLPSSLRSEEVPPSSGDAQEIPEGVAVEAGGRQESAHGGAKVPVRTASVAAALKDGAARGERLLREGRLRPEGSSSARLPKVDGGGNGVSGKKKKTPDPEVAAALAEFAAAYKKSFGGDFLAGPQQLGQMRTLVKRCSGKERALLICVYVLERWPELSKRWRALSTPDLGIVLLHAQAIWLEMQTGTQGTLPSALPTARDGKADLQQDARNRMYADKGAPIAGFDALMGAKPASVGQGR